MCRMCFFAWVYLEHLISPIRKLTFPFNITMLFFLTSDSTNLLQNIPRRCSGYLNQMKQSLIKQSSLDEQEQMNMEMEAQQQENEDEISDDYRINGTNGANASGDGNGSTLTSANADTEDVNAATTGGNTSTATSSSSACSNTTAAATEPQRPDGNWINAKIIITLEKRVCFNRVEHFQQFVYRGHQKCVRRISINFFTIRAINSLDIHLLAIMTVWLDCRIRFTKASMFWKR